VGVAVGIGVGNAICAPKTAPAPLIRLGDHPKECHHASQCVTEQSQRPESDDRQTSAPKSAAQARFKAKTTKPSGNKKGSPAPKPIPAADSGR
jgi:hypothetical protein